MLAGSGIAAAAAITGHHGHPASVERSEKVHSETFGATSGVVSTGITVFSAAFLLRVSVAFFAASLCFLAAALVFLVAAAFTAAALRFLAAAFTFLVAAALLSKLATELTTSGGRGAAALGQLTPEANGFASTVEDLADGSNGWAIAPSHSTGGEAMLLMNPHLAWGGEQTYFEIHLSAPGVNVSHYRRGRATDMNGGVPHARRILED
jgi:hypothetical protein